MTLCHVCGKREGERGGNGRDIILDCEHFEYLLTFIFSCKSRKAYFGSFDHLLFTLPHHIYDVYMHVCTYV